MKTSIKVYLFSQLLFLVLMSCKNKKTNNNNYTLLKNSSIEAQILHSRIVFPTEYKPGQILDVFDKLPYSAFYEQPSVYDLSNFTLTTPFYLNGDVSSSYGNIDSVVRSDPRFRALKRVISKDSLKINTNYTCAVFYRVGAENFDRNRLIHMYLLFVGDTNGVLYAAPRHRRIKSFYVPGKHARIINRAFLEIIGSTHESSSASPPPQFYTIVTKSASYNYITCQRQYIGIDHKGWQGKPKVLRGRLYADSIQWVFYSVQGRR